MRYNPIELELAFIPSIALLILGIVSSLENPIVWINVIMFFTLFAIYTPIIILILKNENRKTKSV